MSEAPRTPSSTMAKLLLVSEETLADLSRRNVLPKPTGGGYELAPTVQAYIRHVGELDAPGTHAALGRLVGVTKQAIQKTAQNIGLTNGKTLREWLAVYSEHQRSIAAGRGGEASQSLTEQRIEESQQKTLSLALANMQVMGGLCPTEDVVSALNELSQSIPTNANNAGVKILETLESKLETKIDDELVFAPIRAAIESISKDAEKLGQRFSGVLDEYSTETTNIDG